MASLDDAIGRAADHREIAPFGKSLLRGRHGFFGGVADRDADRKSVLKGGGPVLGSRSDNIGVHQVSRRRSFGVFPMKLSRLAGISGIVAAKPRSSPGA